LANTAAGATIALPAAAGPSHYHSPQSDNSFDAEYCDVEPDSSPFSATTEADFSAGSPTCLASPAVTQRQGTVSQSPSVQTLLSSSRTAAVSWSSTRATVPAFCSIARDGLLPKSPYALPCDRFLSPVKHSLDIYDPVLRSAASESLADYVAPVVAAQSSARCLRFLPATAAALCDTSTVSSPSFARSICAAVASSGSAAKRPQVELPLGDSGGVERLAGGMSVPGLVPGLEQPNAVVTSSTPVMADVLQAQLDQGALYQLSAAATGLPAASVRAAPVLDHAELLNSLLSHVQLGVPKPDALAASRQSVPNDVTVPVIAFLNLGAGAGSLPSFSYAAVLPPGALQFLKVSVANEAPGLSPPGGTVSVAE